MFTKLITSAILVLLSFGSETYAADARTVPVPQVKPESAAGNQVSFSNSPDMGGWKSVSYTDDGRVFKATGLSAEVASFKAYSRCKQEADSCFLGASVPTTVGHIEVGKCVVTYPDRPDLTEISYASLGVVQKLDQGVQFFPDQALKNWGINPSACANEIRKY